MSNLPAIVTDAFTSNLIQLSAGVISETGACARLCDGNKAQILKAHDLWLPVVGKVRMLCERKDIAKALTPEQERSLIAATAESDSACHTATVLALNTAMRKDEIRLLRWGQIDLEKRTLTVGRSKTEAGAGRLITVNLPAFGALGRPLSERQAGRLRVSVVREQAS